MAVQRNDYFDNLEKEAKKYPVINVYEKSIEYYFKIVSDIFNYGMLNIKQKKLSEGYILFLRCCLICTYDLPTHKNYRKMKKQILNISKLSIDFLEKIKRVLIIEFSELDIKKIHVGSGGGKNNPLGSPGTNYNGGFIARLNKLGLREEKMPLDGNCQFHSLYDQLLYNSISLNFVDNHIKLRHSLVDWLSKNGNKPMDDLDSKLKGDYTTLMNACGYFNSNEWLNYLNLMNRKGEWGDSSTLLACSALFCVKINVISSQNGFVHKIRCPKFWKISYVGKLWLIHIFEMHYNSTRPLRTYS
tara:strand:- start:461 stop:1363 length:903 start_codon:yes stop_codon:yes gene_type:complete